MLLPLLIVVNTDREPNPQLNLRSLLVPTLLQLLALPAIYTTAFPTPGAVNLNTTHSTQGQSSVMAAVASSWAGEPLFQRLLHVLAALLQRGWAPWLSGGLENLRGVGGGRCSGACKGLLQPSLQAM